ncbi:MAG: tetratricopeptide repeat protein [Ruminococcaceae bacterium]|nr:tetratricopeptide repeat protein [Oscillospiraceae bacterium]
MNNGCISLDRILGRLDGYLNKNDYDSAEKHIVYWLTEAERLGDIRVELPLRNELMGLYRKLLRKDDALDSVKAALCRVDESGIEGQVGAATTYLNCATVYKAFDMSDRAMPLFEKAKDIYENELDAGDSRLGGLYNNMALALVDLGRFSEARELYSKAISVMENTEEGDLEVAITYLNIASAAEAELGLLEAESEICDLLDRAESILDDHNKKDGYYAFVCEKCASVFGYYGRFMYERELLTRAGRIYGR